MRLSLLERQSLFRDRTAEVGGEVASGSVNLVSACRDVEVLNQVLENGDSLGSLFARDDRNGRNINSRHFGRNREDERKVEKN